MTGVRYQAHATHSLMDFWAAHEQAQSVNLDIKRVVANRYWCNKLWNAIKFALERLGDDFRPSPQPPAAAAAMPLPCRWILSRLNSATQKVVAGFETYAFADATQVSRLKLLPPFSQSQFPVDQNFGWTRTLGQEGTHTSSGRALSIPTRILLKT